MTLTTLLRDARRDCATLTRGQRFDRCPAEAGVKFREVNPK